MAIDPPNLHALFIGEPGIGLRTLRSMLASMRRDERDEGIEYPWVAAGDADMLCLKTDLRGGWKPSDGSSLSPTEHRKRTIA